MIKLGEPLEDNITTAGFDEHVERKLESPESELEENTGYSYEELGDFLSEGDCVVLRPTTSLRNVIEPVDAAVIPLTIKGAASQSANQLVLQNSSDVVTLSATGFDSTTAFQINKEDTSSVFVVDTTNERVGLGAGMSSPATPLDISTDSNTAGIRIRGTVEAGVNTGEQFPDTQVDIGGWTSLVNVESENQVYATTTADNSIAELSVFGFTGIATSIVGIELKIIARSATNPQVSTLDNMILSWDNGTSWTAAKDLGSNLSSGDTTYTVGGSTDTWGRIWSVSDFSNANFKLRLNSAFPLGFVIRIDYIAITVYHSGSVVSTTEIADLYVGSTGNLVLDLTSGNDSGQYVDIRSEDDEFGLVLRESDGTGTAVLANFYVVDGSPDYLSINLGTTDTNALNITSGDDVGIGTAAPAAKLHIVGDNSSALRLEGAASNELADIYLNTNGGLVITTTSGSDTAGVIDLRPEDDERGLILRESDGTGTAAYANFYVVDSSPDYLSINVTSATNTNSFNITAGADVGIGTAAPGAKLHINGLVDEIQQITEAHSTQTSLLSVWDDSDGNDQITFSGDGAAVFNEEGNDADFRIEGDTITDLLKIDAGLEQVELNGGVVLQQTRVTTTYTILVLDHEIFANTDSAGYTVTLPAGQAGLHYRIINTGSLSKNLTVAPNGSEHLLGANSNFVLADGESLIISYNSTDGWY